MLLLTLIFKAIPIARTRIMCNNQTGLTNFKTAAHMIEHLLIVSKVVRVSDLHETTLYGEDVGGDDRWK